MNPFMASMKRQLKRIARNAAKDYGLWWKVPRAYRKALRGGSGMVPVDPRKVLFVESELPYMPDSFQLLFNRVDADPSFDARFVTLGKHRVSARAYLRNCEELAREAATARIIYLCDASDVVSCLPLRPETRVVQLWHACGAFKRFGMSTAAAGYGLSRADINRHPFYGNLSIVTVSSPEVEWAYVQAMCLEGREGTVQPLGVSRTDVLFHEDFHNWAFRRVFEQVPAAVGKRVVLYAPTYRGDLSNPQAPPLPDITLLKEAIGHDSVLLVKQHPMVRRVPEMPEGCEGFAFEVSSLPIDELLVAAHVLVTDYSSVVFEFSLFNRPQVFFAPDLDDYLDQRNFYYDYATMTPGPVVATSEDLAACLAGIGDAAGGEEVAAFRARFMGSCDGKSTERIWEASTRPGGLPRDHGRLKGSTVTWRKPHIMMARAALNACYRVCAKDERQDEAVFISRQTDEPRYDFAALATELQARGWKTTMHLKKVTGRNLVSYAAHVFREVSLLGRCKVAVLDRYDPVVSLIDFECDAQAARSGSLAPPANGNQLGYANLSFPRKPVVLQLWHAFGAFKKFGFQTVDTPEGHPGDFIRDWRIHHNCTWVVCSGAEARAAFAEAFSVPLDRVVALNRPEYDELVGSTMGSMAGEGAPPPAGEGRLRVLMAPTLRKSKDVPHPMRDLYAARASLERSVDASFAWAFHPLEEGLPAPGDVSDELLECDVVVTDYSSLVYEAFLLGKMVLFFVPDLESYRLTPGLNRDPMLLAAALCARDADELAFKLQALATDRSSYPRDQLREFIGNAFSVPERGSVAASLADFLIGQTRSA